MKKQVIIVDYHLGNIFSVQQACKKLGFNSSMSSDPEALLKADAIILPGVGAFGDAMNKMKTLGLDDAVIDFHKSGRPMMGICLGMQLLFTASEEFGTHSGLNLIKGEILRFPATRDDNELLKVPQTGWNKLIPNSASTEPWSDSPLKSVEPEDQFYFVHSYYAMPMNVENILSFSEYGGIKYCSTVKVDNIFATQYHPEKSAHRGLEIYENWLKNL